jgi:hypothetical protein
MLFEQVTMLGTYFLRHDVVAYVGAYITRKSCAVTLVLGARRVATEWSAVSTFRVHQLLALN